jgi:hypothetical protein
VLTNRRQDIASACRWTVAAADALEGTKRASKQASKQGTPKKAQKEATEDGPVWEVVHWDGGQGTGIFQMPISGPVKLTCTLSAEPYGDFYNRPGVAAFFFDPLVE